MIQGLGNYDIMFHEKALVSEFRGTRKLAPGCFAGESCSICMNELLENINDNESQNKEKLSELENMKDLYLGMHCDLSPLPFME